jgi:hypothetical protein
MPSESTGNPYAYSDTAEVTGAPEYLSPVERHGVPYLPYRGTQFHGVEPQEIPVVGPDGVETDEVPDGTVVTGVFQPPEEDLNPVPVRIVESATHEYQSWRAWQALVTATQPVMVANRKEGQTTIRVRNTSTQGTNRVFLGPDPSVSIYTGYPFSGNDELVLTGEAPIYAIADTGVSGTVTLAVLSEFSIAQG